MGNSSLTLSLSPNNNYNTTPLLPPQAEPAASGARIVPCSHPEATAPTAAAAVPGQAPATPPSEGCSTAILTTGQWFRVVLITGARRGGSI